jgi:hypothetical protein
LAYDGDLQMIRYMTRTQMNGSELIPLNGTYTYINDYNIGVSYRINSFTGGCSIESISSSLFDEDQAFTQSMIDSGNGFIVRMRSPQSILHLDTNFTYTGQRTANSIPADIFISKDIRAKVVVINEIAFTVDSFDINQGDKIEKKIPIRLTSTTNVCRILSLKNMNIKK